MNKMEMKISANIDNEPVVRNAVALFASSSNCTLEDIIDIKTITSEAISNAIIHGYLNNIEKEVNIQVIIDNNVLTITVLDYGVGIDDIEKATKMNFSSKDRTGLGFSIMKSLSDEFDIKSKVNVGTKLTLKKILSIKEK